ncbi:MAG: hypothetical protein HYY35_02975 [Deltaproteobacteria bacterium]|nr:hypothetical protein [Deltaproteobacteria bacterium]
MRADGFSFVSLLLSLLIGFALMALYLKAHAPVGPQDTPQGSALDAARKQARGFEEQQERRLREMDESAR